jgi:hypothetical protein
MNVWEETADTAEIQQRHKGPRPETELHLGSKKLYEALGQTHWLKVVKWAVRIFPLGCGKWVTGHCGGVGPLWNERKDVQSTSLEKDGGSTPAPACTLSGNRSGRAAVRREQQEQLASKNRENWATGKEGNTNHKRCKHSPQKEEMVAHLCGVQDE